MENKEAACESGIVFICYIYDSCLRREMEYASV